MTASITYSDKLDACERWLWEKSTWIEQHGSGRNARPEHEVQRKRVDTSILKSMIDDYRRAVAKEAA